MFLPKDLAPLIALAFKLIGFYWRIQKAFLLSSGTIKVSRIVLATVPPTLLRACDNYRHRDTSI